MNNQSLSAARKEQKLMSASLQEQIWIGVALSRDPRREKYEKVN